MRLVLTMVLALVVSLVAGAVAVTFVGTGPRSAQSMESAFMAIWLGALICLPVMAIAVTRDNARRALFRCLRWLVLVPMLLVILLRGAQAMNPPPEWAALFSGFAEFPALLGVVVTAIVQWRIFRWHAGRPVPQPSIRFGRQP